MTVVPKEGREWLNQRRYGLVTGTINTIALGTGTVAESDSNTVADVDEVYRTSESAELYFEPRDPDGDGYETITDCGIDINIGQQVPLGVTLTEVAVIVPADSTTGRPDILIARDTFGGITLDEASSGQSFERYLPLPVED